MSPAHEPWLVVLSLMMAFQGSYLGLHVARKIRESNGDQFRSLIAISALSMALAIWTMHFVGMLALRLPVAINFLVLPTLMSFLICVLVVGFSVIVISNDSPTPVRIGFASVLMGIGIVSMHYVGMLALHASFEMTHEPAFVAGSVAVGILASMIALWVGFVSTAKGSSFYSAIVMAAAISTMHYTAMAGLRIVGRCTTALTSAPVLSQELLAIVVSVIAFVVSAIFLLTLLPEPDGADHREPSVDQNRTAVRSAPLNGEKAQNLPTQAGSIVERKLPVERDGHYSTIPVSKIVAVQARAHYTAIFDGEVEWFCPRAISEIESILDPNSFARVHRSHIVNLDRVRFAVRGGEAGVVETLTPVHCKIPVSRSRRTSLKRLLNDRRNAGPKSLSE
ncbi:MAG: LytTR family transcriptional regulator DNA-binding domain-containing protein [Afipia sp.]|nr:LytTR family transcriptional regulator DNA-binding domain-containing protein [Afipia sp.]